MCDMYIIIYAIVNMSYHVRSSICRLERRSITLRDSFRGINCEKKKKEQSIRKLPYQINSQINREIIFSFSF